MFANGALADARQDKLNRLLREEPYAHKIASAIKRNIAFTEEAAGNPETLLEVRTAADGKIIQVKLIQASGNDAWDQAVVRGVERTEQLPLDVNGKVPAILQISFRPNP
jgi:colicin import membrane protein